MKRIQLYLSVIFVSLIVSCQDIIDLDLPEGDKLVVLNGLVSDTLPVWVDVLQTANYNEDGRIPDIDGATVFLFEDDVQAIQLLQDTSGRYTADFTGTIGKSYHIQVIIPQSHPELGGTIWESAPELMRYVSPIDSMYQKYLPQDIFQDEGRYVFYQFTDPLGAGDRYRIRIWENDTVGDQAGDIIVFEDLFFDGRSFDDIDLPAIQINGSPAKPGHTFKVEHTSISKAYLDYLSLVQEQTTQVGGLFDPPPALLRGNIFGITEPSKTALGYFAASANQYGEYEVVE